jgi:hypothetical protein
LFKSNAAIRKAPAEVWNMYRNADYSGLAKVAVGARSLGAEGASAYVAAYAGSSMPSPDEVSSNQKQAGDPLYLNRQAEGGESSCAWPMVRDSHQAFQNAVPVTYVQGEWDVRCPVEGAKSTGDASSIFAVSAMGHDSYIDSGEGVFWEEGLLRAWLQGSQLEQPAGFPRGFGSSLFNS